MKLMLFSREHARLQRFCDAVQKMNVLIASPSHSSENLVHESDVVEMEFFGVDSDYRAYRSRSAMFIELDLDITYHKYRASL